MKRCIVVLFILFYYTNYAQNTGKITYDFSFYIYTYDTVKTSVLHFTTSESLYQWGTGDGKKRTLIKDNMPYGIEYGDKDGRLTYKNLQTGKSVTRDIEKEKAYIITEDLIPIDWQIGDSVRTIGGLVCQQATGACRGRIYEAWFTPDIPVSSGPWRLWGLPGLILEAHSIDGDVKFWFKSVTYPSTENYTIQPSTDGTVMTWAEYVQMCKDNVDKMVKFLLSQGATSVTPPTNRMIEKE